MPAVSADGPDSRPIACCWRTYSTVGGVFQCAGADRSNPDAQKMFADVRLPTLFLKRREDSANYVVVPDLAEIDVLPLGRLVRFPPIFVYSSLDPMARTVEIAVGNPHFDASYE
jgi:hypothetical protein